MTSGEKLNIILNEENHVNNTPSHKSNHPDTGKNNPTKITVQTMHHQMKVVPTVEKEHSLSVTRL